LNIETPAKFKGKEAFYEKMYRMFIRDLPESWSDFDAAMEDMDNAGLLVHKVKGTAGNLDITEVYQCALQLEASMRNGEPDMDLYQMFVDACTVLKNSVPPENGA
jgi:HPt (histidine-containing phosphotransfer) domain-containing protein